LTQAQPCSGRIARVYDDCASRVEESAMSDSRTSAFETISPRATRRARYAAGKALRKGTPREVHADFKPTPARDALGVLRAQDGARITALVAERYRRMAASPFAFLRDAFAQAYAAQTIVDWRQLKQNGMGKAAHLL
jgi:hypothetical protein